MKNLLKKEFEKLNITQFGFTSTENINEKYFAGDGVFSNNKKISSIQDILPDCKSIIAFLMPYNHGRKPINLSLYATGKDYHTVAQYLCKAIGNILEENGYKYKAFSDISPLKEREIARLCGLGIIGENGFLINKEYGSYTFIAYLVTDCEISPSSAIDGSCLKCGKCKANCPKGAIGKDEFNVDNCVSYITQKKGELTDNEKLLIKKSGSAWGCDICQTVCPMNKDKLLTPLKDFNDDLILCIKNEYLSNKEFKEKYKERAFSWRGKSVVYRNLSILDDTKADS